MKRYQLARFVRDPETENVLIESVVGEWMRYEDIAMLEKEFKETIEGADEQINRLWKALEKIYHMRNIDVKIHNIAARALWYEEQTE